MSYEASLSYTWISVSTYPSLPSKLFQFSRPLMWFLVIEYSTKDFSLECTYTNILCMYVRLYAFDMQCNNIIKKRL